MPALKSIDRIAVAAMLSAVATIPLVSCASLAPPAQVLTDDVFAGIQAGMPAAEVLVAIGPPDRKERFDSTRTTAWDYRYRDTWGYDAELSVIVDDRGVVVGKISTRNSG